MLSYACFTFLTFCVYTFNMQFCSIGVDKIIGFGLSHHLKNNKEPINPKDAKLTLSSERLSFDNCYFVLSISWFIYIYN